MIKIIFSILIAMILYDLLKIGYKIIINKFFVKKVEKIFDSEKFDNTQNFIKEFWED